MVFYLYFHTHKNSKALSIQLNQEILRQRNFLAQILTSKTITSAQQGVLKIEGIKEKVDRLVDEFNKLISLIDQVLVELNNVDRLDYSVCNQKHDGAIKLNVLLEGVWHELNILDKKKDFLEEDFGIFNSKLLDLYSEYEQ